MSEVLDREEDSDCPMSPNSRALILGNLFRKETNGDPIDFYIRKTRIIGRQNQVELEEKLEKLKEAIEKGGGCLWDEPTSPHSIELVFHELIDDENEIDTDLFEVKFVDECYENGELLDLEDFRLGKSPYNGSIKMNDIMNGLKSWDSVRRQNSPQKGRKLPDFGLQTIQTSPIKSVNISSNVRGKKSRVDYTIEEDLAVLKFLIKKNLYDKVGGNTAWKTVHREFPSHSYQSLQNRFRRFILPNLHKYKGLTDSERKFFDRGSCKAVNNTDSASPNKKTKVKESSIGENIATSEKLKINKENYKKKMLTDDEQEEITNLSKNETKMSLLKSVSLGKIQQVSTDETNEVIKRVHHSPRTVIEESQLSSNEIEDSESVGHHRCMPSPSKSDSSCAPIRAKKNKTTVEFTVEEDKEILKYIYENKKYSEVSGSNLWIDIRDSVFNENRNWKSIKRRFQRVIMQSIEGEEYGLDRKVIRNFQKSSQLSKSSTSSEQGSDSDLNVIEHNGKKTFGQNLYTVEEDKLIINYIVARNRFEEVRGKLLWVDIQDKVLHKYNRTWQSAKNRFLRNILKKLHYFNLKKDIVKKFELGAVAERNLGGMTHRSSDRTIFINKRRRIRDDESDDDFVKHPTLATKITTPPNSARKNFLNKRCRVLDDASDEDFVKHPALAIKRTSTPNKQPAKRKLYKQPIIPLPVVFTPQPGPSSAKQTVEVRKDNITEKLTKGVAKQKSSKIATSNFSIASSTQPPTKLVAPVIMAEPPVETLPVQSDHLPIAMALGSAGVQEFILKRCSVTLTRLTQAELDKYGCTNKLFKTAPVTAFLLPPPVAISSSPKCSRFTVEISPSLYAARLSTSSSKLAAKTPTAAISQDKLAHWFPLSSSLSRQCLPSIRTSNQSPKDDSLFCKQTDLSLNSVEKPLVLNDSPPSSPKASTIDSCGTSNDESNANGNKSRGRDFACSRVEDLTPKVLRKKPSLPSKSTLAIKNFARLQKDNLSSDDYYTPTNTDGYYTPDG